MTKSNKIVAVAAVVIIVAANGWVFWRTFGRNNSGGRLEQSFYTTDDGATYFADDASRLTPFDHDGKPAVLAHVYSLNGKRWVGYLERYTEKGRELMEALQKHEVPPAKLQGVMLKEVKKPGETRWVTPADGRIYSATIMPVNPNGAVGEPRMVGPAD